MHDSLLDQLLTALDRAVEWAGDREAMDEHDAALDAVEARLAAVARHLGGVARASPYLDLLSRLRHTRRSGVRVAVSA